MTDRTWTNWSDLKFIARKREFWLTATVALVVGVAIGLVL